MIEVASLTFNPFQENTYIVYDETKEAIIFDPGCYTKAEEQLLVDFITNHQLQPVRLINTHCHIDHVLGNYFVAEKYGLKLEIHKGELPVLDAVIPYGTMMGLKVEPSPAPEVFLEEGDEVEFGNSKLAVLFTPGHSPASISFYSQASEVLIAGDVLFYESIGRTDLPGGDFATLIKSIKTQFFTLEDQVRVFPGHGPATTIGHERKHNPFLR